MSDGNIRLETNDRNDAGQSSEVGRNDFVDPGEIRFSPGGGSSGTDPIGDGPSRARRRGRPAGSTNKKTDQTTLKGIEKTLLSLHSIAAGFFATPEIAIDEEEAKLLTDAVSEVAKHYNVAPDPITQAWINLGLVAGTIYGPRIWIMMNTPKPKPVDETNVAQFTYPFMQPSA